MLSYALGILENRKLVFLMAPIEICSAPDFIIFGRNFFLNEMNWFSGHFILIFEQTFFFIYTETPVFVTAIRSTQDRTADTKEYCAPSIFNEIMEKKEEFSRRISFACIFRGILAFSEILISHSAWERNFSGWNPWQALATLRSLTLSFVAVVARRWIYYDSVNLDHPSR